MRKKMQTFFFTVFFLYLMETELYISDMSNNMLEETQV